MSSAKKDKKVTKQIHINDNELKILSLIKEGLLGPCTHLMSEREQDEVVKTGHFQNDLFPYPLTFAPRENLTGLAAGDRLELICKERVVGQIQVKSKFKNNKKTQSIFTPNNCPIEDLGDFCVGGDFEIYDEFISQQRRSFQSFIKNNNAKKITALFSSFNPLHRAHERIFRWTIDKADVVVVFLIESYENDGLEFDLKEKYLHAFAQKYLPLDKIFIFSLRGLELFGAHLNPGLESIVARKLGCTKLVVGQNHSGLGMFYSQNQPKTILDEFYYGIEIIVLPEFVFCDECHMIVSTKSCPHGSHHHLHYHSQSLKDLLKAGIMPPSIFMRKEISSLILAQLAPNKLPNVQKLYNDLFATRGILEPKTEEDFYQRLLETYQMSYMS